jgi:hypothetical protein
LHSRRPLVVGGFAACLLTACSGIRAHVEGTVLRAAGTADPIYFDVKDRISIQHAENLLRGKGITASWGGTTGWGPVRLEVAEPRRLEALAHLRTDPLWSELEERLGRRATSIINRAHVDLRMATVDETRRWLVAHCPVAAELLDYPRNEASQWQGVQPHIQEVGVAKLAGRKFMCGSGEICDACEIQLVMVSGRDGSRRTWAGQVMRTKRLELSCFFATESNTRR